MAAHQLPDVCEAHNLPAGRKPALLGNRNGHKIDSMCVGEASARFSFAERCSQSFLQNIQQCALCRAAVLRKSPCCC